MGEGDDEAMEAVSFICDDDGTAVGRDGDGDVEEAATNDAVYLRSGLQAVV